ncbi:MAG: PAS domain S-box-containing protein [Cellvibrionaceae bacterium]|jgi:PAS domain S-box-containing protein
MTFDLTHIALLGITYLVVLFVIAYAANNGWISKKITNHPLTYVLSLGIFFSAWSFYGVIDLAYQFSYGALAYYMGTGAFFLFSPIIQAPLAELCQRFQLRSIADLLVFRYNSQLAGSLATLFIFLSIIPLLVLQIQAVADTSLLLTQELPEKPEENSGWNQQRDTFALFYCLLITAFCMIFGAGYSQYKSLVTTMAFESVVKVVALMTVGLYAIYGVFGGFAGLDQWLIDNGEYLVRLHSPTQDSSSHTLLLVFIATGVLMPHIFHMSQMDRSINEVARMMTWAFPLFLLLMALPVFPILWAGFELKVPIPISYFTLGVPQFSNAPIITMIAWVGGLSAASGALVVSILSLATMVLNQWLLPLLRLQTQKDIYAQLRWLRRVLIIGITFTSYLLYLWLDNRYSLMDLALLAFVQALQFVPGVVAISYWPRANRFGFFAGIISGSSVWLIGLALPVLFAWDSLPLPFLAKPFETGIPAWETITLISIGINIAMFSLVSYLTPMGDEERYHAEVCAVDELSHPFRRTLDVTSAKGFKHKLAISIGDSAAEKEVNRALHFLELSEDETRPYALRRLRTRIRTNLSGLLGHTLASDIIERHFPYRAPSETEVVDINLMESRLERLGSKMQGLTADVNQLRIHYRNTLLELPIAICSVGLDDEILLWNNAMSDITGITGAEITGSNLRDLPSPWRKLISDFVNDWQTHINRESVDHSGNTRWYRLHKSAIQKYSDQAIDGQVILMEDFTNIQLMEQELMHNTRLASIGRLAAGVAHEIGNPVTGIACLAQNLRYEEEEDGRIETADAILSQTDRISRIVQSLVTFAHSGKHSSDDFHQVNISECANEAIHLLSLQRDRKPVEYSNNINIEAKVLGDSQRLIQVFINLLGNANDASPEFCSVTLSSSTEEDRVEIDITDEGTGIAKEHLKHIMEPFFSTKETGKGTGLGLAVVFSIIEEHQGNIHVTSPVAQGRGTRFTIQLPLLI